MNRLANHANRGGAAPREGDTFGAHVVGVWSALEIVEPFELSEQVVEGPLADS